MPRSLLSVSVTNGVSEPTMKTYGALLTAAEAEVESHLSKMHGEAETLRRDRGLNRLGLAGRMQALARDADARLTSILAGPKAVLAARLAEAQKDLDGGASIRPDLASSGPWLRTLDAITRRGEIEAAAREGDTLAMGALDVLAPRARARLGLDEDAWRALRRVYFSSLHPSSFGSVTAAEEAQNALSTLEATARQVVVQIFGFAPAESPADAAKRLDQVVLGEAAE
jgi:hypothetical protein